jgi:hypothetical protein
MSGGLPGEPYIDEKVLAKALFDFFNETPRTGSGEIRPCSEENCASWAKLFSTSKDQFDALNNQLGGLTGQTLEHLAGASGSSSVQAASMKPSSANDDDPLLYHPLRPPS